MGEINFRLANQSDAAALAELRYAFRSSTGVATEAKADFLERCGLRMAEHLREGTRWHCWVAETDQRLIGAIWLQLVEKIPNPRAEVELHGYITNLYLEPAARGQGTGSRLLDAAIDYCKTQEVHAVILWPTDKSITLYERYGFAVRSDLMELILKDAGPV